MYICLCACALNCRFCTLNIRTILVNATHFNACRPWLEDERQLLLPFGSLLSANDLNIHGVSGVCLFSNIVAMFNVNMLLVFVFVVVVHYCLLYLQVQVTEIDA